MLNMCAKKSPKYDCFCDYKNVPAPVVRTNISLIGFMGVGKTTVCEELRRRYSMDVVEADDDIVKFAGMSINDIFFSFGEEHFRDLESEVLASYATHTNTVISCGGGAVLRDRNVTSLKRHSLIVLLTASPETILTRVKDDDNRPKLRGHKNVTDIASMMAKRAARYREAADIVIDTDGKTVAEICEEIMDAMRSGVFGPKAKR